MISTEGSETTVEMASTKPNQEDLYSLSAFLDKFKLPAVIRVVDGYHGMNGTEDETLSAGEIVTLYTLKTIEKVQAESASGVEFEIPLKSPVIVKEIERFSDQVYGLKDLLKLQTSVKFVRVTQIDHRYNSELFQGDKLEIKGKVSRGKEDFVEFEKIDKEHSGKLARQFKLPINCQAIFQPLVENQEYLLSAFVKKVKHFPVLARPVDSESNRDLLKKVLQSSYFGILNFKGVNCKTIVIGTARENDGVSLLKIPKDLDISVIPLDKLETDSTKLDRRENENLFKDIQESEIYENFCEMNVLRRECNIEYIYEEMAISPNHSKQKNDNSLEIKHRFSASPNAYSPTPKSSVENLASQENERGTPTELICSEIKTKLTSKPILRKSLSLPLTNTPNNGENIIKRDLALISRPAPRQDTVSRDENSEEELYEEIKIVRPVQANQNTHLIRSQSDVSYAQNRSRELKFQPYESMTGLKTPKQNLGAVDGLYAVSNISEDITTSQLAQQQKETGFRKTKDEIQRLQNTLMPTDYMNSFQTDMKTFSQSESRGKTDDKNDRTLNTTLDACSDSKAKMFIKGSTLNKNPVASCSSRGVQIPKENQIVSIRRRADSLAVKERICSSYIRDSREAEIPTETVSIQVASAKTSIATPISPGSSKETLVYENIFSEQNKNYLQGYSSFLPQREKHSFVAPAIVSRANDKYGDLRRGNIDANTDSFNDKQDQAKIGVADDPTSRTVVDHSFGESNKLPMKCLTRIETERRFSCPEICEKKSIQSTCAVISQYQKYHNTPRLSTQNFASLFTVSLQTTVSPKRK